MEELAKAIYARYLAAAGAALRVLTPGGMWPDQAAAGVQETGNYIIFMPLAGPMLDSMSTKIVGVVIQFSAFASSDDAAQTVTQIMDAIAALYDDVLLSMTGYKMIQAARQNTIGPLKDPDEGFFGTLDYLYRYG